MSIWAPTKGANSCPLKPRQWLQRAETYLFKQKEDAMCVLTWGEQQICALCVAGSKWTQKYIGKPTQVMDPPVVTYGNQPPSCCLIEIPISELFVHFC
eukprot:10495202-Ditylum_brightwellii.AAC.1